MGSENRSRGKVANDDKLFGVKEQQLAIKNAVADLSFLLERHYAEKSALQLVGNRYKLNVRQQKAVQGMSASNSDLQIRKSKELKNIQGKTIVIDGFNLIIILESALSEAYIFKGLDGCYRDLSCVHGTYKKVKHTHKGLIMAGNTFTRLGVKEIIWYLDQPISNSGRLKMLLLEIADLNNYNWQVELVFNPDKVLAKSEHVVVSSDAWILNEAKQWFNLAPEILRSEKINLFEANF
ncbi:MAG: DUF434 domain-containing protein [Bacteroidia bacterium]